MGFKKIIQSIPVFLLTIPLTFFINTASNYYSLLHWNLIITAILLYLALPIALYFIAGKLTGTYTRTALFTGLLLIVFYFFSDLHDALKALPALSFLSNYSILLPVLLVLLFVAFLYVRKMRHTGRAYYVLNILFLLLTAGGLLQLVYLAIKNPVQQYDQANAAKPLATHYRPCNSCIKPDIYYLLLDGYTNSETLQNEFGFDNHELDDYLVQKGFYDVRHSRSNYNFTHMSLGSVFNMDYLMNLHNDHSFYTKDFFEAYYTIDHAELFPILAKEGYTLENYSIFTLNNQPTRVTPFLTELTYRSVLGQTFLNKLRRDIGWHLAQFTGNKPSNDKLKKIETDVTRIQQTYNGVVQAATTQATHPRFVYAHFILPHETPYFGSSGKRLPLNYTAMALLNRKDYVMQVAYVNRFIIKPLVDTIFARAQKPFIIIVQGDHGYRGYPASKVALEFRNLNAFYFPGQQYALLNDSMTSVNTFRVVLNQFFAQRLPLLKDSCINLLKHSSH